MYPLAGQLGPLGRASTRQSYIQRVLATSPAAYWPLNETSGTTAQDASGHGATGTYDGLPDLGQPGIGDGQTAPYFDLVNGDRVNIYSAALAAAFTPASSTMACWARVQDSSDWTSPPIFRSILMLATQDLTSYAMIRRDSGSNSITCSYVTGGVTTARTQTAITTPGWFHVAMTFAANGQMTAYFNGVQVGLPATIGGWTTVLGISRCAIGSSVGGVPSAPWRGYLAHAAYWSRILTASEIASLATV